MEESPTEIYYSNGAFLIFNSTDALKLRRHRILCQPVSGDAATGPHCLSPYATRVAVDNGLAIFKKLESKRTISCEQNQENYRTKLLHHTEEQKNLFMSQRLAELSRHGITPTPQTIGIFDESKLRLEINSTPDNQLSSFNEEMINDVIQLDDGMSMDARQYIYEDLYRKGFYISSGMKFGCDFLAYLDDPVRYHAQYAVRLVSSDEKGSVDLRSVDILELNSFQRLTHTANKTPLFVTVIQKCDTKTNLSGQVKYWTLGERVYLSADSSATDFELVELDVRVSAGINIACNKSKRLS